MRHLCFVFLLAIPIQFASGQATSPCDEAFAAAETSYIEGRFNDAADQLAVCINQDDLSREQAVEVYRLLALAYLRMEHNGEARAAIMQLFEADPDYRPDPINDPPSYTVLVEIVRSQIEPSLAQEPAVPEERSWVRSHLGWVVTGGAIVAGGLLAAILSGGDDPVEPSSLPPPPGLPQ